MKNNVGFVKEKQFDKIFKRVEELEHMFFLILNSQISLEIIEIEKKAENACFFCLKIEKN
jgi:hypothetical protein